MKTKSLVISVLAFIMLVPGLRAQEEEKKWSNTPFEIKTVDAQQALVVKASVPMNDISAKMGEIYQKVFTYVMENEIEMAGPSIAVYYTWDPEGEIVFEAGVPVAKKAEGNGEIVYQDYASMKVLATLYKGAYEDMEPVYNNMMNYISNEGLQWTGVSWEVYLTDPSKVKDPSMNQTLIYFPLK